MKKPKFFFPFFFFWGIEKMKKSGRLYRSLSEVNKKMNQPGPLVNLSFPKYKGLIGKGIAVIGILSVMLAIAIGIASAHCSQTANPDTCHGCCYSNFSDNNNIWCLECGDETNSHCTSCTFDTNLTCEGDGLIAKRYQTKIIGNGSYHIEGNGTGTGIYSPWNQFLTIYDLEIKNFERGIWLQNMTGKKIYNYRIGTDPEKPGMGCNIHDNAIGIEIDDLVTKKCIIGNCEIHSNDRGIYVHGENGKNIKITNNEIYINTISGIYCEGICMDCEINSNQVSENGEGITMNASQWTVKSSVVTNNSGSGIYVGRSDTDIKSNVVCKNKGDGIHVADEGVENVTLESNTVCNNQGMDIFAEQFSSASGVDNACNMTYNYNDTGAEGCTYDCTGCIGDLGVFRCGGVVTESCTFNVDLTCPGGDGLIVGADDIVIEGANYTVDGVGTGNCGYRAGICSKGHNNITLNNLEVKNFCNGIRLEDGEIGTIYNCTAHDNGNLNGTVIGTAGIWLERFKNCSITNNTVYNNAGFMDGMCEDGGIGIRLYGHSNDCSITNNTVYNNSLAGIFSKEQCMYNYVAYNNLYENGVPYWKEQGLMTAGVRLQCMKTNHWTVENNTIKNNKGPGVFIRGEYDTLKHNEIEHNSGSGVMIVSNYNSLTGL